MNCSLCKNNFNCIERLPVIDSNGHTICAQCASLDNSSHLVYNKQLIRMMGHCSEHIASQLSLFCIEDKKYVCEKCVLYGNKAPESVSKTFVQNSKMKEAISEKTKKQQIALSKINESKDLIGKIFFQTQNECFQKIEKEYSEALESINKKRDEAYQAVILSMEQLRKNYVSEYLQEFEDINTKIITNKEKTLEKKLLSKIQNLKCLQKVQHDIGFQLELLTAQIKAFADKFTFKINFTNEKHVQDEQISFCLSSQSEEAIEEISLLQPENEEKEYPNENMSWFKFEEETDTASNISSISLPAFENFSKKPTKGILVLKNCEAPKIGSNVKEIKAEFMSLSNSQAKKLLQTVKKSFAHSLDLSNNKISSLFLRDLSKVQVGKYLKEINLSNNEINKKDLGIKKKIEALEKQGVKIFL